MISGAAIRTAPGAPPRRDPRPSGATPFRGREPSGPQAAPSRARTTRTARENRPCSGLHLVEHDPGIECHVDERILTAEILPAIEAHVHHGIEPPGLIGLAVEAIKVVHPGRGCEAGVAKPTNPDRSTRMNIHKHASSDGPSSPSGSALAGKPPITRLNNALGFDS